MRGEKNMPAISLRLTWGISRGRETMGYNIASLRDEDTGKRYRCLGGGYDMTGTVFGEWLESEFQGRLQAIGHRAHMTYTKTGDDGPWDRETSTDGLYGMSYYTHDGRVVLDGGCGLSSMERIANAIGLTVQHTVNRKGHVTGFIVTEA